MGDHTDISWAQKTFNGWEGCQHVSPACDFCYAEDRANHWKTVKWGPHGERRHTSAANWRKPYRWNEEAKAAGVRYRVFAFSLADWLDNKVPPAWRGAFAEVVEDTPHLDWMLLSKRIQLWDKLSPWAKRALPPNVWIGSSAEMQRYADERGKIMQRIDARVRFFSCEPLLGPIVIKPEILKSLQLVITGGESGRKARITNPDHFRMMRDQCGSAGVPFHHKQNGEWVREEDYRAVPDGRHPKTFTQLPNGERMIRVGAKHAGRFLDGVEHMGMPS